METKEQKRIFNDWLGQYKGLFFKVAHAYAAAPSDCDDLFQEIAIQVWKSVPNFKGDSGESTWLYRVALHTAMSWQRQEKKHRNGRQPLSGAEQILVAKASSGDRRLDWLYEQIAALDKVERSLMLLALDGYSYREMAHIIGISESNVGVKISRIKKRLVEKSKDAEHGI